MTNEIFTKTGLTAADAADAVRTRRSVRTFTGAPLPDEVREVLEGIVRLPLLTGREKAFGTYGVVRGAACFIRVPKGTDEAENIEIAAQMEDIVLWLTAKGLGTCWLGATFHNAGTPGGVQALIAAGVTAPKSHLLSRITSALSRSATRLPFGKMFEVEDGSPFMPALEMVRLAPSALNKQPWRAVQQGDALHFYCTRGNSYRALDMGIARAHFDLLAPSGRWAHLAADPALKGTDYCFSYIKE